MKKRIYIHVSETHASRFIGRSHAMAESKLEANTNVEKRGKATQVCIQYQTIN